VFQPPPQVRGRAWHPGGLVFCDEDTIIIGKPAKSEIPAAYLLQEGWGVEEIKTWAKERWKARNPKLWPPLK